MKRKVKAKRKNHSLHAAPRTALPVASKKVPKYTTEQIGKLKTRALELYEADQNNAMELGGALRDVKKALPHGEFNKWWRKEKLSQARVSYCLRLAQGKVAAAKLRISQTPERAVMSEIRQNVSGFLQFCSNEKSAQTLDQVDDAIRKLFYGVVTGIGRLRHWPTRPAGAAANNFSRALTEYLESVFEVATMEDVDRATLQGSPRASDYIKKPVESTKAAAATSAAGD